MIRRIQKKGIAHNRKLGECLSFVYTPITVNIPKLSIVLPKQTYKLLPFKKKKQTYSFICNPKETHKKTQRGASLG